MTSDKLARADPTHLAAVPERPVSMLQFTPEQSQIIRDMCASGASESEFAFLMEIAKQTGLNPLLKQIHFVKRWDKEKNRFVWAAQVGIDGFRSKANKTGLYDGQDEPEFGPLNDKAFPQWARVKVWRKGVSRPFVGLAYWAEYVQTTKEGNPTRFWREMPMNQLAKCAEALGLRKAFPDELGGLYTPDEMGQADNDRPREPHSPHDDGSPPSETLDPDVAADLIQRMTAAKEFLQVVDSYDKTLQLREILGSSSRQSKLTKDVQAAKEARAITVDEHRELSKIWAHCNRQCAKLEKELAPSAEASFSDGPESEADPDNDGR
jgi:phage recombination protein Bet